MQTTIKYALGGIAMIKRKLFVLTLLLIFSLLLSCDPDEVNILVERGQRKGGNEEDSDKPSKTGKTNESEKTCATPAIAGVAGPMGPALSGILGADSSNLVSNNIIFYANDKENFSTTATDHVLKASKKDGTLIDLNGTGKSGAMVSASRASANEIAFDRVHSDTLDHGATIMLTYKINNVSQIATYKYYTDSNTLCTAFDDTNVILSRVPDYNLAKSINVAQSGQNFYLSDKAQVISILGSTYRPTITDAGGDNIVFVSSSRGIINLGAGNDKVTIVQRPASSIQRIFKTYSVAINAGAGNDIINGGPNKDTIDAGPGNDVIIGGEDDDTITIGQGNDIVIFDPSDGTDIIKGSFEVGKGKDVLDLSALNIDENNHKDTPNNNPAAPDDGDVESGKIVFLDDINNLEVKSNQLTDGTKPIANYNLTSDKKGIVLTDGDTVNTARLWLVENF